MSSAALVLLALLGFAATVRALWWYLGGNLDSIDVQCVMSFGKTYLVS